EKALPFFEPADGRSDRARARSLARLRRRQGAAQLLAARKDRARRRRHRLSPRVRLVPAQVRGVCEPAQRALVSPLQRDVGAALLGDRRPGRHQAVLRRGTAGRPRRRTMLRHRGSAVPLTWLYVALIVYASLYPFTGWRAPGVGLLDLLLLGSPDWWTWF